MQARQPMNCPRVDFLTEWFIIIGVKAKSQQEILKSIRKSMPPPTKVIRPNKGGGYKRPRNGRMENEK